MGLDKQDTEEVKYKHGFIELQLDAYILVPENTDWTPCFKLNLQEYPDIHFFESLDEAYCDGKWQGKDKHKILEISIREPFQLVRYLNFSRISNSRPTLDILIRREVTVSNKR